MKIKSIILLAVILLSCTHQAKIVKANSIEQWMGVYLKQEKIGYSFSQYQRFQGHYKLTNRVKINLAMMGQPEEVISLFSGTVDTGFALQKFDFSFQSKKNSFSASGVIKDNHLLIETKTGGSVKSTDRDIIGPVYPAMVLGYLAMHKNFKTNQEYNLKVFDATVLTVVDAKLKILGKEKIIISGKDYQLTKMTVTLLGLTTTMWVDENGVTRKEESPPSMTMIEETRDKALAQEAVMGKLDILSLYSIPIDTLIPAPRNIKYLKLKITEADLVGFNLSDNSQTILQTEPFIIEINTPSSLPKTILPIQGASEFLKPSLYIQCDNNEIEKMANKIVGSEKEGAEIVRKLIAWVFANVNKRATASLPSAIDVLHNLEGDCNEHSVLFAACARAAGIPTQICVGLVYVDGSFYYHAWNKVYLGDWISVDPTFGQSIADATHIKLAEGELEEQAKVLRIVGERRPKTESSL